MQAASALTRESSRAERFFRWITRHPWWVVAPSVALVAAAASGLTRLHKDTSSKAYMAADHPAYLGLERVEETFGLSDPVVVAVVREGPGDVFDPETLELVRWLTERTEELPGVDPERVTSLATVKSISGSEDGMRIEPFFDGPVDAAQARRIREDVMGTELYVDKLVSRDGRTTVIVAELLDLDRGNEVYEQLRELAERAPRGDGDSIHVAGLGAYNALVGEYIDADAARLNPITGLLIVLMLFAAYRTWRGVWVPCVAVVGSVVVAMGTMAALGSPVYGITNSMSIILIAIAVCDGIHIMGEYYAEAAGRPAECAREHVVRAMTAMWRPVTITSLTSMAGFLALAAASEMPPMRAYGVFAALGVLAALLLSALTIPALLSLLRPQQSPAFRALPGARARVDRLGRWTEAAGRRVVAHAGWVLGAAALAVAAGVFGLLRLEVEDDTVQYLAPGEPLREAELAIDEGLGGISNLDVVLSARDPEGLYEPEHLRRMAALQQRLEAQPGVRGTFSLADYVKQMHRAMNADDPTFYRIPDDPELVAQYFLLYSASADPTDFDDVADYEFREANVRVSLDDARWSTATRVVASARRILREELRGSDLEGSLAGWGNVRFHMREDIARSQPLGVALASVAVLLTAVACFRSLTAGLLSLLPVGLALLLNYAVMGLGGIWLSLITSMGSALAIGLSIDFSIHTLDRTIQLVRRGGLPLPRALPVFYAETGRALLFNFAALLLGFGVLTTSLVPAMRDFGLMLVTCIATGFAASMVVLPALVVVLRLRFLAPFPAARGRSRTAFESAHQRGAPTCRKSSEASVRPIPVSGARPSARCGG
jgi:predicted RND superfamily exporter protein